MVKVLYPRNFKDLLNEYREENHPDLKEAYIKRFKKDYRELFNAYEKKTKKEIENHHIHEQLRSCCIIPFIYQKIQDYELLNLEPLAFPKFKRKIPEIPIFDFLIVGIEKNFLKCVILGEVKGGDRGSNLNDLNDFEQLYKENSIRNTIFEMIKRNIPQIKISNKDVKFHYTLAIDEMYFDAYEKSVKSRNLNLEIWKIKSSLISQKYSIEVHTLDTYDNSIPENFFYNKLIGNLNKKYEFDKVLDFSFKTDTTVILKYIKEAYVGLDNSKIDKGKLMDLISKKMCGDFIEEKEIIEIVYERIIKKGKKIGIIVDEKGQLRFKRINPVKYIADYRIQNKINKDLGKRYLDEAAVKLGINKKIDTTKFRSMDEFMKKT